MVFHCLKQKVLTDNSGKEALVAIFTSGTLLTKKFIEFKEKAFEDAAFMYRKMLIFISFIFLLLISAEVVILEFQAYNIFLPYLLVLPIIGDSEEKCINPTKGTFW